MYSERSRATAALEAREAELDSQQEFFKTREAQWQSERTELQNEVRQLLATNASALRAAA